MRAAGTRVTPSWIVTALILCGCSGDDYPRPPCRSTQGALNIALTLGGCPSITSFEILPNEVDVGGTVQLHATTTAVIGEVPHFSWTASAGIVDDASSADASFTCTAPGSVQVTLTVNGGDLPAQDCSMITTGSVQCDAVAGAVDSGASDAAILE